ncbi:hypothetical protein QWT87_11830 [Chryseobacterium sp. APV1]|uniref:Uncharacterized protein n=1 Tax=Chryseobacterium urinae TaxID=3058400 RepID=A0ABT8U3D6_9FLAO|nr:hypothetical protein [Chryseobacterium sp. APV1]MDO3425579.1 hypothetical protein [Chryseobacterium sp. APV1]
MEFEELEQELQSEIEKAEEIAIENIQNGVDFSPFIYFGEKNIKKLKADSLDEAIEMAEEEIEDIEEETVVLIYKNNIQLNDGNFDAIVSQVYNVDEDSGYSFGLVYKIEDNKIKFLNKRVFLGNIRNCLIF